MANPVSPRNMKRAMASDCLRVRECGSRVSGSLAAMLTIFLRCASAGGGPASVTRLNTARITGTMTSVRESRDRTWLGMEFPLSDARLRSERHDRRPGQDFDMAAAAAALIGKIGRAHV